MDYTQDRRAQMALMRQLVNRRGVRQQMEDPFVGWLRVQLQWDDECTQRFAAYWHAASSVVGLRRVKGFLKERLADAVGRFQLNEMAHHRHVILEGDFGTGKKTAAQLIARLYQARYPWSHPLGLAVDIFPRGTGS